MIKKCRCGSGKLRWELRDAAGIFCQYVCDACVEQVKKGYNPAIFRNNTQYAVTGNERDIDADDEFDAADYHVAQEPPESSSSPWSLYAKGR